PISCLCRDGPGANAAGSKTAPLKRELVVIVPISGRPPQPSPDCFPLLPACALAVEGHTSVVEPHVIQIDVSFRQNSKGSDGIEAPETRAVIRRIVEEAGTIQGHP